MVLIIVMALCAAIVFYIMLEMILSSVLAERIRLDARLTETQNLLNIDEFQEEEAGSVMEKLMKPLYNRFLDVFALLVTRNPDQLKKTDDMLKTAGVRMDARDYRASILLMMFIMAGIGGGVGSIIMGTPVAIVLGVVIGIYAGFTLSRFSITSKIKKRKASIYHDLPEMMDLLHVSVSAGLGFDQAIGYIVKKSHGALFEELGMAQREITLGRTRKEALTRFADRCDNMEIRTFVTAVIQADEMGSSLSNVLEIQADTIRDSHKQAVEEKAQKLSVKMLIPMVLFVFPVLFIVLMAPAVLSILDSGAF